MDKQTENADSSEPSVITPAVYVGKSRGGKPGKGTAMHHVTYNRALTVEEERAVKAFADETVGEKRGRFAKKRGWKDSESGDYSWPFRRVGAGRSGPRLHGAGSAPRRRRCHGWRG